MKLRIRQTSLHVTNLHTRIPFRYGIATLTAAPHLFLGVRIEVDGRACQGYAADNLPPKWFTKNPATHFRDDLKEMAEVIRQACSFGTEAQPAQTPFDLWREIYNKQMAWGAGRLFPPLLSGFGASLLERALIDAFCHATGNSFGRALRTNTLGIRLGELHPELNGSSPRDFLPEQPLRSVMIRHTVGLTDPLTDDQIPAGDAVDDGLPQSLEACVRVYGLTRFKIKLCGDAAIDIPRLREVSRILRHHCGDDFSFTLDGNEQFHSADSFQDLWQTLSTDDALRPFLAKLIFVEQPFHRDVALAGPVLTQLRGWRERPPLIIDESDATLTSLPEALAGGYIGTSHKNCKGVFKGIANACLIAHRRAAEPQGLYVLSGEDLTTVGPVSLLQDLTVAAGFGISHIERNGHHYFRGLSMFPASTQEATLQAHDDLYRRHDRGFATLRIADGRINIGSVIDAPFGYDMDLDLSQATPLADWQFESL